VDVHVMSPAMGTPRDISERVSVVEIGLNNLSVQVNAIQAENKEAFSRTDRALADQQLAMQAGFDKVADAMARGGRPNWPIWLTILGLLVSCAGAVPFIVRAETGAISDSVDGLRGDAKARQEDTSKLWASYYQFRDEQALANQASAVDRARLDERVKRLEIVPK